MLTERCTDGELIDLMKTTGIADNLEATSGQPGIANVIPQTQGFWTPASSDEQPVLKVQLSSPPEKYKLITITVTAQNFQSVTVTLKNATDNYEFSVSLFCCDIYVYVIMHSDATGQQFLFRQLLGDHT